jgi:outer membrane receptor protein involved in Fe transport
MALRHLGAKTLLLATALTAPTIASAQEASGSTQGAEDIDANESAEIVVTASRREERVIDAPYNVSAISAEVLERSNITDVASLARFTPGIAVLDVGNANRTNRNPITIRGLNVNAADVPIRSDGAVPTVAQYVGEAPVQFPVHFFDVNRVELLRGPQGTLYGSGALAGTLRVLPNLPDLGDFFGTASATLGAPAHSGEVDFGGDAMLNLPLGDRAAIRIAGGYRSFAGFIDSVGKVQLDQNGTPVPRIPGDLTSGFVVLPREADTNDSELAYVRGSLRFEPSDTLSITLSHEYQYVQADNPQEINPNFAGALIDNSLTNFPGSLFPNTRGFPNGRFPNGGTVFPAGRTYDQYRLIDSPARREFHLTNLVIDLDLDFATLTSSTSYVDFSSRAFSDRLGAFSVTRRPNGRNLASFYGFYPRLIPFTRNDVDDRYFTQEVRLVSNGESALQYVVGAFFQHQKTSQDLEEVIPGVADFFGLPPGTTNTSFTDTRDFEFRDFAIFGELTYNITDRWQVTGGIRQFWQRFTLDGTQTFPFCGADCANDGLDPTGLVSVPNARTSVSDQTFKLNTSYKFDDFSVYATFSEGFRRGGTNNAPVSGFYASLPQNLEYRPDTVQNYEAGIKGRLGPGTFSLSAFLANWNDFQFQAVTPSGGSGIVLNGPRARTRGLELELSSFRDAGLSYSLGYTFVEAEVREGFTANDLAFGTPVPLITINRGDRLPGVPKHTLTGLVGYGLELRDDMLGRVQVDASYRSDAVTYFPGDPVSFANIDGFAVVNAQLSLEKNDKWKATLFAENVFDVLGATAGNFSTFELGVLGSHRFVIRPRTVGIRLSFDFGN